MECIQNPAEGTTAKAFSTEYRASTPGCPLRKGVLVIRCKQIEAFDRSFEESNPCYTHYSCFGWLLAFRWLWLAW